MALVDSNANQVHDILSSLNFLVVQDVFISKTAVNIADVICLASFVFKKEGTFTNTERRVQRLYQALPTARRCEAGLGIIQDIANRLGANWSYSHPGDIFSEMQACLRCSPRRIMTQLKDGTASCGAA